MHAPLLTSRPSVRTNLVRDKRRSARQGFGDVRLEMGPLLRRTKPKVGAGVHLSSLHMPKEDPKDPKRCAWLRHMAQELRLGLRDIGAVSTHKWFDSSAPYCRWIPLRIPLSSVTRISTRYHMRFADTFTADDAVTWITQERGYLGRVVEFDLPAGDPVGVLQELLDYGFIRRVSKWETPSSVGWETTEHVLSPSLIRLMSVAIPHISLCSNLLPSGRT